MRDILEKYRSKRDYNLEKKVQVNAEVSERVIDPDNASVTLDNYAQYISEKDASNKYRLIYTINPICSNILFNAFTEVVWQEGSSNARWFKPNEKISVSGIKDMNRVGRYLSYKGYDLSGSDVLQESDLIADTAFSHPDIGPFVYHCGYDIFNNHTLRKEGFFVTNKMSETMEGGREKRKNFNSIRDYVRGYNGEIEKESITKYDDGEQRLKVDEVDMHLYTMDTIKTFLKSINTNLVEKDGWVGFINPSTMEADNFDIGGGEYIAINKCINNNKSCEFIDMYPDRSLYSFLPKYNEYRNRDEYNWEYRLTYPYKNYYNSAVRRRISAYTTKDASTRTSMTVDGLLAHVVTPIIVREDGEYVYNVEEDGQILLRTDIRHNLEVGDFVTCHVVVETEGKMYQQEIANKTQVLSLGSEGLEQNRYFTVGANDILPIIKAFVTEGEDASVTIYIRKVINNMPCKYYFRVFKAVPNFNGSKFYNGRYVTDSEIDACAKYGFQSTVTKLAFERSIYNDKKAQIVFTEDIDLSCLSDNLGRPLSEVYLTIVKTNKGYEEWYEGNTRGKDVEYSHCFGKITAGLDLSPLSDEYNVHKIHNISAETINKIREVSGRGVSMPLINIPYSMEPITGFSGITINGDKSFGADSYQFLGDLVEFSPSEVNETTIEDVYFRFNTAQREYDKNLSYNREEDYSGLMRFTIDSKKFPFPMLIHDEITSDDYDIGSDASFKTDTEGYNRARSYNTTSVVTKEAYYPPNLFPEGYYYKPHYKLTLKEFKRQVLQGTHTRIACSYTIDYDKNEVVLKTSRNYYLQQGDTVIIYDKNRGGQTEVKVTAVSGVNFELVTVNVPDGISDEGLLFFKKNILMPDGAYELEDGTGRYLYRELKKELDISADSELYDSMFTNGAHYFHRGINFFLKRQDPTCEYGLGYCEDTVGRAEALVPAGMVKDITQYEYVEEEAKRLC